MIKFYKPPSDEEVDQKSYFLMATLSVLANVSADKALKYIDYQTKVIAKCKLVSRKFSMLIQYFIFI